MKKLKIQEVIACLVLCMSVFTLNPVQGNAAWIKDSAGWWNTEGSSWSVGWRMIEGDWYYFGEDGYMQTGWVKTNDKWYYLYSNGAMAVSTTIDGYEIDENGAWIEKSANALSGQDTDSQGNKAVDNSVDFDCNQFVKELREKGYNFDVKDSDTSFLPVESKKIDLKDSQLYIYSYDSNEEMEKSAMSINCSGPSQQMGVEQVIMSQMPFMPHCYKKGKIIVQYFGENKSTILDLNSILGDQFSGSKETGDTSTMEEIKKKTFDALPLETQKKIKGTWKDFNVTIENTDYQCCAEMDDKSYEGRNVYCIEYTLDVDYVPDNRFEIMSIDTHKIVGYCLVD